MSGIAGIIRFDEKVIDPQWVESCIHVLKHRGKSHVKLVNNAAFISFGAANYENSESTVEIADVDFFDNKTFFANHYTAKGLMGFNDLNADFAAVIWDIRNQKIICGRDILGVKPLYYMFKEGGYFAFSSEIKALLPIMPRNDRPINYDKFEEYLTWRTTYLPYNETTFYQNIKSVLPAHALIVDKSKIITEPFWHPNIKRFENEKDLPALFKHYFFEGIQARIQNKTNIASHLSGGLDSSSVSAVAQSLLGGNALKTFYIDTGLESTNEKQYVEAILKKYKQIQHENISPHKNLLENVIKIASIFDRPENFIVPSSFHLGVAEKAQKLGYEIILTGHDGDSVVQNNFDYLDILLSENDWETLKSAAYQFISSRNLFHIASDWENLNSNQRFKAFILEFIGTKVTTLFRNRKSKNAMRLIYSFKKNLGGSYIDFLRFILSKILNKLSQEVLLENILHDDFKLKITKKKLISTAYLTEMHFENKQIKTEIILNTNNILSNEQLNHIGNYYGHQYSFPFFDKNVVEIGLATAPKVGFDNGRGRGLIRQGLSEELPLEIINRLTKTNFVEYGNLAAIQLYEESKDLIYSKNNPIWDIVSKKKFNEVLTFVKVKNIPIIKKTRYNWLLSRVIYLSIWMDRA